MVYFSAKELFMIEMLTYLSEKVAEKIGIN